MKKKILIVEDSEDFIKLYQKMFSENYEFEIALNGRNILKKIESFAPDLIILDLMLADGDSGLEVCGTIKLSTFSHLPIIVISAKTEVESRVRSYQLGAINFLQKPFDVEELDALVSSLLRGGKKNDGLKELTYEDLKIDLSSHLFMIDGETISLTPSEFLILKALMKRPNQVFEREQLLNLIDQDNLGSSDRVVDNHMSSLRRKIVKSRVKIKTVYSVGYQLKTKK